MLRHLPKRLISWRLLLGWIVSGCLLLVPAQASHAVSLDGISAYPTGKATSAQPWFIYALAAGQSQQSSLTVTNTSSQTQQFSLYPVDALLASNNSFAMLPATSPRQDVASWITLSETQVQLAAHTTQAVLFTIHIPATSAVGKHYGGIIVQPQASTQATAQGNATVVVTPRLGVRVYETIPGTPHQDLQLAKLTVVRRQNTVTISGSMQNNGNTLLSPQGTLVVRNSVGKILLSQAISVSDVFRPGQTVNFQSKLSIPKNLPQKYRVSAIVTFGSSQTVSARASFWVGQAIIFAGLIVILGVGSGSIYLLTKRQDNQLI